MKTPNERIRKKRLAWAAILLFFAATALICWQVGIPMVRLASEPEHFRQWIEQQRLGGQLIYIGMVALQVLAAIIPGEALEIAGGYAFGALEGTILCLIGGTLGSFLVICLVRRFGMPLVELFFSQEKLHNVRFLKSSPKRTVLFLLIFMIPGTPKDLLCYFAGLTDMKWRTWLLIATVGRLPSIVTSTVGGGALGDRNYTAAAIAFGVALAAAGVGYLVYRAVCRRNGQKGEEEA